MEWLQSFGTCRTMKLFTWKNVFILPIFCLFLFSCFWSFQNLLDNKTGTDEKIIDGEKILYPSITVCKKYTFDYPEIGDLILNKTASLEEKKKEALKNVWSREKLFYFVSHPTMMNLTFPCTTTDDGTDPGKPCAFPVKKAYVCMIAFCLLVCLVQ